MFSKSTGWLTGGLIRPLDTYDPTIHMSGFLVKGWGSALAMIWPPKACSQFTDLKLGGS